MIKGIVNSIPKDIKRVAMPVGGVDKGWEVRDQLGNLLWGAEHTLTGIDSINFKGYGTPLTAWSINGNMVQSGIPSPDNIDVPQECGDKTRNLAPVIRSTNGWRKGYRKDGAYVEVQYYGEWLSPIIEINGFNSFVISAESYRIPSMSVYFFSGDTYLESKNGTDYSGSIFDSIPAGATHFDFAIRTGYTSDAEIEAANFWVMLNTGSTALPYEPYGYKIPITNGGTTYPVYIAEPLRKIGDYADTIDNKGNLIRIIKKLILTGTENWIYTAGHFRIAFTTDLYLRVLKLISMSDHYYAVANKDQVTYQGDYTLFFLDSSSGNNIMYIRDTRFTDASDFAAYIAEQYSRGTPVTVWYVLANPTLEKITVPKIQTEEGTNYLEIETETSSSYLEITGHIKNIVS